MFLAKRTCAVEVEMDEFQWSVETSTDEDADEKYRGTSVEVRGRFSLLGTVTVWALIIGFVANDFHFPHVVTQAVKVIIPVLLCGALLIGLLGILWGAITVPFQLMRDILRADWTDPKLILATAESLYVAGLLATATWFGHGLPETILPLLRASGVRIVWCLALATLLPVTCWVMFKGLSLFSKADASNRVRIITPFPGATTTVSLLTLTICCWVCERLDVGGPGHLLYDQSYATLVTHIFLVAWILRLSGFLRTYSLCIPDGVLSMRRNKDYDVVQKVFYIPIWFALFLFINWAGHYAWKMDFVRGDAILVFLLNFWLTCIEFIIFLFPLSIGQPRSEYEPTESSFDRWLREQYETKSQPETMRSSGSDQSTSG